MTVQEVFNLKISANGIGESMARPAQDTSSWKSLFLLAVFYVIFNLRYLPGQFGRSLLETAMQMLTSAPIPVGLTILVVSFLSRMHGERPPWDRIVRLYFTFGIITGFLFALNEYWETAAPPPGP
jgi:hypothetical protein